MHYITDLAMAVFWALLRVFFTGYRNLIPNGLFMLKELEL